MKNTHSKRAKEKEILAHMIHIYCNKNHGTKGICNDCKKLKEYAFNRSDRCPFKEEKTFCSNCKIHCYKKDMRIKIKKVMRFSGPRIIFIHPIMAVKHLIEDIKERKFLLNRQVL